MNCAQFQDLIGMRCNQIGDAVEVITPFTFADGDFVGIFAQAIGTQVLFFDDGLTLEHLNSFGIRLGNDRRRWQPLRSIAATYGVTLSDAGVFETLCPIAKPSNGFARMVSTLLGVAAWEREQAVISQDSEQLIEEVAFYLRAWKPKTEIIEKPVLRGFTGRTLTFDFFQDGQYIDALSPHSASTGAELRKLVDLASAPWWEGKDVLVVVDDRTQLDAAKHEIGILGRVSKAWPMSELVKASGDALPTQ